MTQAPYPTLRAYLGALRRALAWAPPALVQDALADAEEHIRAARQANPGLTEEDIMAAVTRDFGTPDEVSDAYRTMEAGQRSPHQARGGWPGFFGVAADPLTYGALVFMLLALPTGIFYFTWVVTGLALSAGLMILIIGVPFALLFLASVRVLAHLEGRLVEALLGRRMPRRLPPEPDRTRTLWERISGMLTDGRTWTAMLYLALRLPLGIAYFVTAVVGLSVGFALVVAPIAHVVFGVGEVNLDGLPWPQVEHVLETPYGPLLLVPVGVLLLILSLHLARGLGWLHARLAEHLLVRL